MRIVDVETQQPSPMARSLLFGYIGQFMYEGDQPLAERRAAALSLDSDPARRAARHAPSCASCSTPTPSTRSRPSCSGSRRTGASRDAEDVADLLRLLGDLTTDEAAAARRDRADAGRARGAAARDPRAHRRRGALARRRGRRPGPRRARHAAAGRRARRLPRAGRRPARRPVSPLRPHPRPVPRHRRRRAVRARPRRRRARAAPAADVGPAASQGEFRPGGVGHRVVRRRGAARDAPPLAGAAAQGGRAGRHRARWRGSCPPGRASARTPAAASTACSRAIEQLQGAPIPASMLETLVLPSRVADYSPVDARRADQRRRGALGRPRLAARQRRLGRRSTSPTPRRCCCRPSTATMRSTPLQRAVLDALGGGGALFFRDAVRPAASHRRPRRSPTRCGTWSGRAGSPTTPCCRCATCLGGSRSRRDRRGVRAVGRRGAAGDADPHRPAERPPAAGRCCPTATPTRPGARTPRAEALLDRHGVLTRGAVMAEHVTGGFAAVYPVLKAFEETGRCRRGYFVEGLGAAQFATAGRGRPDARDGQRRAPERDAPWQPPVPGGWRDRKRREAGRRRWCSPRPTRPTRTAPRCPGRAHEGGHRPGRKAGALVVLVDGELVLYVERGGKSLLSLERRPGRACSRRPTRSRSPSATACSASSPSSAPTARRS